MRRRSWPRAEHLATTAAVAVAAGPVPQRVACGARVYRQSSLWQRQMDGKALAAYIVSRGTDPRSAAAKKHVRPFLRQLSAVSLSKSEAWNGYRYLLRCLASMHGCLLHRRSADNDGRGVERRSRLRKRRTGAQGRPQKALPVKHLLYQRFLSIRKSVKSRIPVKLVLTKARALMEDWTAEHLKLGLPAVAGAVGYMWLSRWKRDFRVSLRQPNRKWGVPRHILEERLEITWLNVARVRRAIQLVFGYDPEMLGFDQSPFHMNEVGSQNAGSLAIRGCGPMALKEGHAATRERWTANAMVYSRPGGRIPPLQILFRASGGGGLLVPRLRRAVPPWAPWLSVSACESGSYDEVRVLDYLAWVLEPATEGRDWRILLVDAFLAQTTEAVRRFAWGRKYVLVVIGGGCTGTIQVNDTDLHQILKKHYVEMEAADALMQSRLRPSSCPVPRKEDCIQWMAQVWGRPELHSAVAEGWQKTGLGCDLRGVQDHLIVKEAGAFWRALGMTGKRAAACRIVEGEIAAARLGWSYEEVTGLVVPFPPRGRRYDDHPDDEGSEAPDGGESDDTAGSDDGDGDDEGRGGDDDGDDGGHEGSAVAGGPLGSAVAVGPSSSAVADVAAVAGARAAVVASSAAAIVPLSSAEAAVANDHQHKMAVLRSVLDQVTAIGADALSTTIARALHAEEKLAMGKHQANAAVAAALCATHEASLVQVASAQSMAARTAQEKQAMKRSLADMRAEEGRLEAKRLQLAKATAVAESLEAVKAFADEDIGVGHAAGGTRAHRATRKAILHRLRLRASPLPADLANDWDWFVERWDTFRVDRLTVDFKPTWGFQFRTIILYLLNRIRDGEPDVLASWMREEMRRFLPLPALRL